MSAESEMRNLILHAAEKLAAARNLTVVCERSHGPRTLALPIEFYVATTYAETMLRMLAAYLKVESPATSNGQPALMPPRDPHGRFAKQEVER